MTTNLTENDQKVVEEKKNDEVNYTEVGQNVLDEEKDYILKDRDKKGGKEVDLYGLAISGGGIRSASFGLGIMQALVRYGVLKKMDYLSTVSGGGYLGSSLTWFLKEGLPDGTPAGTKSENFPFGKGGVGARLDKTQNRNATLDFIRQHGNYLIPGKGVTGASLLAALKRNLLVNPKLTAPAGRESALNHPHAKKSTMIAVNREK